MSLNDDLLMEVLDKEIPPAYRHTVEKQLHSSTELSRRLGHFQSIQKIMHQGEAQLEEEFASASARLRLRLNRNIDAIESSHRRPSLMKNMLDFNARRWVHLPLPAAAAAALVLIAVTALNFLPRTGSGAVAEAGTGDFSMNLGTYAEFSDVDPHLLNLLSVSSPENPSADGQFQAAEGEDGINLQINVQDMEQLLRLIEGARNINGGIDGITIQLPEIPDIRLHGESQFIRPQTREDN